MTNFSNSFWRIRKTTVW